MTDTIHPRPYIEMHPAIARSLDSIGTFFDTLRWAVCFSRLCQEELLINGQISPQAMERINREINGEP